MRNKSLVFLDTETTGLSWNRQTWEVALIRDNPDGSSEEFQAFLPVCYTEGEVNEESLKIGKFYERYPAKRLLMHVEEWENIEGIANPYIVGPELYRLTYGATIVGMCPDFDAFNIWKILRGLKITSPGISDFPWYYQLLDVDILAAGVYLGQGREISLPVDTDRITTELGVTIKEEDRHTAMGDVRWTRDFYYALLEKTGY